MVAPSLLRRVIKSQGQDTDISSIRDLVQSGTGDEGWDIHTNDSFRCRRRVMVPQSANLGEEILKEFH